MNASDDRNKKFAEIGDLLNPEEKPLRVKPKKPLSLHPDSYDDISFILGLFSIVPVIGTFTGMAAVIFGVLALLHLGRHPERYGKMKAWTGIILGAFFFVMYLNVLIKVLSTIQNVE